ncbi:hypothetical protein NC653_014311 [Populus alba x Populus x berolinensis]|uniref:Uncharacterized protein n=1 Tax=Populus alba x Populus x berolinensis TaxID=444605 RepID=A0AAD6QWX4_9ROSI|nr:hypothetical protein NC653_014311 [Populus alba x Populus x berolinensis]
MDLTEGVGESSSPPRSFGSVSNYDVRSDVYNRFIESGHEEAVSNPELFRELLDSHFNRLPASYGLDVNMDRIEDVLLHRKLLAMAKDPARRPVYHIRFLEPYNFYGTLLKENYLKMKRDMKHCNASYILCSVCLFSPFASGKNLCTKTEGNGDQQFIGMAPFPRPACDIDDGAVPSQKRIRDCTIEFEPCSKLEDLNLDVRKSSKDMEEKYHPEDVSRRQEVSHVPIHEVIFSTVDKPKLLSQKLSSNLILLNCIAFIVMCLSGSFENVMGPFTLCSSAVGFTVYAMDRTSTCAACWYMLLDAVCQAKSAARWYLPLSFTGKESMTITP